jgi:hypothetical protein
MPRGTSPYDEARLQGRLWTPDHARGNAGAWYRLSDPSTLTFSGGNVTGARDLFCNHDLGYYGTVAYSAGLGELARYTLPTFPAGTTPGYLKASLGAGTPLRGATVLTVVALCRTASTTRKGLVAIRASNVSDTLSWSGAFADMCLRGHDAFLTSYGQPISIGYSTNTWFIWSHQFGVNAYLHETFLNDAMTATASANRGSAIGTTAGTRLHVGTSDVLNASAEFFDGQIAEMVILINGTDRLRRLSAGYVAWQHGMQHLLPASHPYRNRPPLIGG